MHKYIYNVKLFVPVIEGHENSSFYEMPDFCLGETSAFGSHTKLSSKVF